MDYIAQILVVMIMFAIIVTNCLIYHYLEKFWIMVIEEEIKDFNKKELIEKYKLNI